MTTDEEQSDDDAATSTVDEAVAAYKQLTTIQKHRLRLIGDDLLTTMGTYGRTSEDLIQDAMLQVLMGKRNWKPSKTSFLAFIAGVMKSIASHTAEAYQTQKREEPWFESELIETNEHGEQVSPLDNVAGSPGIDEELIKKQADSEDEARFGVIYKHFEQDEQVFEMLVHQSLGLNGATIQREMKLSDTEFKAVDRRRRRGFDQLRKKLTSNGE